MAINPPISENGIPLRVEGELLVLKRYDIETEIKIPQFGKKKGRGYLFVTTARLVFVNDEFQKKEFKSFDIPLTFLYDEKFEQPIFGSNYLAGKVKPLYNLLPGDSSFKFWFKSGGCNKFLKCFCVVLDQIRKRKNQGPDPRFLNDVRDGSFGQQEAFVDPNDPTTIFVTQPEENYNDYFGKNSKNSNSYYGDNYSNVPTQFVDLSNKQQQIPQKNQQQNNDFGAPPNLYQQQYQQNAQVLNAPPNLYQQQQFQPQQFQSPQYQGNNQGQNYQQNQQFVPQGNSQNQQQPQPVNVGYYYGFGMGPKLDKN